MFTRVFFSDAIERAIKTAAQSAVVMLGASTFDVLNFNWVGFLSVVVGATVLSLLTSVASAGATGQESASVIK